MKQRFIRINIICEIRDCMSGSFCYSFQANLTLERRNGAKESAVTDADVQRLECSRQRRKLTGSSSLQSDDDDVIQCHFDRFTPKGFI